MVAGAASGSSKISPRPAAPTIPVPRMNQKGLLERDLTPRKAITFFSPTGRKKPMAHIYGHSWPIRWASPPRAKWSGLFQLPCRRTVCQWRSRA